MKKIIITIGVLVFALTVGAAYAYPIEEVMPGEMSNDNYAFNGISVLDAGPGCSIAEGAAAGGLASETPGLELGNDVKGFDAGMLSFEARSSCLRAHFQQDQQEIMALQFLIPPRLKRIRNVRSEQRSA